MVLIAVVALGIYLIFFKGGNKGGESQKAETIEVKAHSDEFNNRVAEAINAYLGVRDAFVEGDTAAAKSRSLLFISLLDSIPMEELKKDTAAIYEGAVSILTDIKSNMSSLVSQSDISSMRRDFSMATEMMYPGFFKMINYEGPTLYLQHCPMAFGDDSGANWLSNSAEIINPYLGKNHPEYKATMLHCGEVKDSITNN